MQQFRVVILDDYDNVVSVKMESEVFPGNSRWDADFESAKFNELMDLDSEYNLNDYDNVPFLDFEYRCTDIKGNWSDWKHFSDPVEDWYNL